MQIVDQRETAARLPAPKLIAALEQMFVEGCEVPLRQSYKIESASGESDGTLLLMPAWQKSRKLGVKTVSIYPNNRSRGLPGLHSTYILFDAETGAPIAMLDGDTITSRRTAAASALAARYLSRVDASTLLLLGSGRVASLIPEAYTAVRRIQKVMVWDIDSNSAATLVENLNHVGMVATVTTDLESSVAQADVVSCATLSTRPLVHGKWLRPGTHLDLIGGFTPTMRESDNDCYVGTSVFIDTDEALAKAGDLLEPIKAGVFQKEAVCARLEQLCRKEHPGRKANDEITLFKAVGTALEDLAAACTAM
ncbi:MULTISPECIES: bifunctional Delta(1)-pyrroline-2-carboxylate/Delta(1)-piperideine-2-carboxylate reductase [Paraburkholderia]|uniref:Ornithine cyclodeaminase n=1 Tax=Paraburkholderia phytofirmans OLGA172 TaxID=1417228 RepID=A0A160FMY2_9BURK|nr:ornithine cyclodeaminase family protein [Paraburkholderia phytofirmans]ANB73636.1 ornithine cyclodeaminase [Paraburkholderia phytofirmans OLGA172]